MSMNKAIAHGKEHRKPYRGSKAISYRCRNHGSCQWCLENRIHKNLKTAQKLIDEEQEWWYNNDNQMKK